MTTVHVFVYGTLKRGQGSHLFLAGQEFLGEGQTLPRYRLYDSGRYPCLIEDSPRGTVVRGEVWRVSEEVMRLLDAYEGAPELFRRHEIALAGFDGPVLAYFYNRDVSGYVDCGGEWP